MPEWLSKVILCRTFEEETIRHHIDKRIKLPIYLSIGQELIPAVISSILKPSAVFIQHRGHSTYICFNGDIKEIVRELLSIDGRQKGSASISDRKANIFGHSGLMGDQVPIAVGYALATGNPTYVTMGDASCEEDYVLGALGFAATKNLPILFIVEDNNLSILTEKKVRRCWSIVDVAKSFHMCAHNLDDNPHDIASIISVYDFSYPMLLNINTIRAVWHVGSGYNDSYGSDTPSRLLDCKCEDSKEYLRRVISDIWQSCLK